MALSRCSDSAWEERWRDDRLGWHLSNVNSNLEQFFHKLTGGHGSNESLRIFVPLCGKSLDLLWLAKQGHEVVGVELVKKPIECFFTENNLSITTEDIELTPDRSKASLYRCTREGTQITILHSSIYSVTEKALGGKFHAVWDRASLGAIDPADRVKYVAVLKSLLLPGGRLLLDSLMYDQSTYDGPPFSVSEEELQALFQESFHIQELGMEEFEEQPGRKLSFAYKRYCRLLTMHK